MFISRFYLSCEGRDEQILTCVGRGWHQDDQGSTQLWCGDLSEKKSTITRRIVSLTQALNSPHVDGGNRDSGSDADPSDCSSDVQVVETGRSPYQQPTPNLRNKELKRMTISCISEMMGPRLNRSTIPEGYNGLTRSSYQGYQ